MEQSRFSYMLARKGCVDMREQRIKPAIVIDEIVLLGCPRQAMFIVGDKQVWMEIKGRTASYSAVMRAIKDRGRPISRPVLNRFWGFDIDKYQRDHAP